MATDIFTSALVSIRGQLSSYLRRLVASPETAEDLTQTTAVRALEARDRAPSEEGQLRKWLFAIGTRLAIDELRRQGRWRDRIVLDLRREAESRPAFLERAGARRGSPDMTAIAREHLAVCLSCVLRNLTPERAAALLLKEIYGFTNDEVAEIMDARFAQVKNWIQEGRSEMEAQYDSTCALLNKQGVCYQCVELDEFFNGQRRDPLAGSDGTLDARLAILKDLRGDALNAWHVDLLGLLDELN